MLIKENQIYQVKEFSTFLYMGKRTEVTETIPLICTSALWGQCPVLSHSEAPQGTLWLRLLTARLWASCFCPEFPQSSASGWLQYGGSMDTTALVY